MTPQQLPFTPPAEVVEIVRKARRPVLFSHIYPDGDSIGAQMGMLLGFESLGAQPRVLNAHPAPAKYAFLDPRKRIEVLNPGGPPNDAQRRILNEADLLLILDTSDPDRLGQLRESVWQAPAPRVAVDHHLCNHRSDFDLIWSETSSPSTASLVHCLLVALGVKISPAIAEALLVGLGTDTGWFRFSNSDSSAFQSASALVAAGAVPERVFVEVFENSGLARTRLLGRVLAELRSDAEGRIVHAYLGRDALLETGVPYEEIDGFIDFVKGIEGAEIAFLIVELSSGRYKVSLRSKGAVDVHPIAERFGGGGHAKAAGCRLEGSQAEVEALILDAARAQLNRR